MRDMSRFDPMKQRLGFRLQENDQVRRRDLSVKKVKDLFVKGKLMVVQIDGGEYPVFIKEVITKGDLIEQIELGDLFLLLETIQQKEDLGLKGIFLRVFIQMREERVLFRLF